MHFLPDLAHCCRCRSFYGHLLWDISYSRNQGTPQSAYSRATHCAKGSETPESLTENCLPSYRLGAAGREEDREQIPNDRRRLYCVFT